jgi:hypothetical protein
MLHTSYLILPLAMTLFAAVQVASAGWHTLKGR